MKNLKDEMRVAFLGLGILALVAVIAYVVSGLLGASHATPPASQEVFVPGPPSLEVQAMLEKSKGFQALVSYTDAGFEPLVVSIKKGETIRFVNNSSEDLWVASTSVEGNLYPGESDCGTSMLDTCKPLAARAFWEFTFDQTGTWGYMNNLHKDRTGVVTVK